MLKFSGTPEYFLSRPNVADNIIGSPLSAINIARNVIINVCDTNAFVLISARRPSTVCTGATRSYSPIAIAIC